MDTASPRTKGARRCTNPECEFGNRRTVRTMTRLKNGKLLCLGKSCHTVYEPRHVIGPGNEDDWRLYVSPHAHS